MTTETNATTHAANVLNLVKAICFCPDETRRALGGGVSMSGVKQIIAEAIAHEQEAYPPPAEPAIMDNAAMRARSMRRITLYESIGNAAQYLLGKDEYENAGLPPSEDMAKATFHHMALAKVWGAANKCADDAIALTLVNPFKLPANLIAASAAHLCASKIHALIGMRVGFASGGFRSTENFVKHTDDTDKNTRHNGER